jgi:hypothetical protein
VKPKTYARLAQLEQINARRVRTLREAESSESAIETIRELLNAAGVEQEGNESLAETTARALGITYWELVNRLREGKLFAYRADRTSNAAGHVPGGARRTESAGIRLLRNKCAPGPRPWWT